MKWTWELAYLIGLLITDGNVGDTGAVSFVSEDCELVEFVRNLITPGKPIHQERTRKGTPVYRWLINSIPLSHRLVKLGIIPRKSLICLMPHVPNKLKRHFIRGVLDGDGTIDKNGRISFSSGSRLFADGIQNLLTEDGLTPQLYQNKTCFNVYLGVKDSIKLAHRLYDDGFYGLPRKRARARFQ